MLMTKKVEFELERMVRRVPFSTVGNRERRLGRWQGVDTSACLEPPTHKNAALPSSLSSAKQRSSEAEENSNVASTDRPIRRNTTGILSCNRRCVVCTMEMGCTKQFFGYVLKAVCFSFSSLLRW
jgi:hypothetical protein